MSAADEIPAGGQRGVARHVAIIADGNRRWARARRLPVQEGHKAGADTLKARLLDAIALGVRQLTVYSFSTENWTRDAGEVDGLLAMLANRIAHEAPQLQKAGVRMRFIGRRDRLPDRLLAQMLNAETLTATSQRLALFTAIDYGSRAEIIEAARSFHGNTEQEFRRCLYASDMHDPELIIRTGGEQRLSNYLLWQAADADLIFREELWPDFTRRSLLQALARHGRHQQRSEPTPRLPPASIVAARYPKDPTKPRMIRAYGAQ